MVNGVRVGAEENDLPPGYSNGRLIGRGRQAAVYQATKGSVGVPVALKVFPVTSPERSHILERELEPLRKLHGKPHIVQIHDLVATDDRLWLEMQLCRGSLTDWIRERSTQVDPDGGPGLKALSDVVRFMAEATIGLGHVHAEGYVHADIKPANLLLDGNTVRLADFGVSRLDSVGSPSERPDGAGTHGYRAPELRGRNAEGRPANPTVASDIYALGVTLAVLLEAVAPRASNASTMTGGPLSASEGSAVLFELAEDMQALSPGERPSLGEVQARLFNVADDLGFGRGMPPRPLTEQQQRKSRRWRLIASGVVLILIAAGVGSWVVLRGGANSDVLFHDNFTGRQRWRHGVGPTGEERYADGNYEIVANHPGYADWITAPTDANAPAVRITARARIARGGNGGWGVWCRGDSAGERYEFSLTHTGTAYIAATGQKQIPIQLKDVNPFVENTITGECSEPPGSGHVLLRMFVNGVLVQERTDTKGLFPPGENGIHAFSFGDTKGDGVTARFSSFELASN